MALKAVFHDIADVPEKFRELYSETSPGVWTLTGVEGVRPEEEFRSLRETMGKELADAEKIRAACERNGISPEEFEGFAGEFAGLKSRLASRDSEFRTERIQNVLRETAIRMGVRPEALPDVLARASVFEIGEGDIVRCREENGALPVAEWLEKQLKESPHWLNPSRSAGVRQCSFARVRPLGNATMAEVIAESWNKHK